MKLTEMYEGRKPVLSPYDETVNVGMAERWASVIGGAALTVDALRHANTRRHVEILLGTLLLHRGLSGHSNLYRTLNLNSAQDVGAADNLDDMRTTEINHHYTINRSPEELYAFWRRFDNLPRFMEHLESVEVKSDTLSHWKAKGPAGSHVEWDAEITEEVPNEMIAWRSVEGSDVANAGMVRFRRAPAGRGTEVEVHMEYAPPAGVLGSKIAKLFGEEPERQMREDLRRFKQLMEAGEVATVTGQPIGP